MKYLALLILLTGCGFEGGDTVEITWDNTWNRTDGSRYYYYETGDCELDFFIYIPQENFFEQRSAITPCANESFFIEGVIPGYYDYLYTRIRASDYKGVWSEWSQWTQL